MTGWRRLAGPNLLLAVLALAQLAILLRLHVLPTAARIWQVRSMSALERSAQLAFGDHFAGYVEFLKAHVPQDAKVILPPSSVDSTFGNTGVVQYYLFPRRIDNCGAQEIEACVLRVTGKQTYLLAVPGFPPRELAERSKEYVEFDGEWGIYVPRP